MSLCNTAEAVRRVDPSLAVLGMTGSAFFDEADRRSLRTVAEAFADRAYQSNGQLVSRREPGATCCQRRRKRMKSRAVTGSISRRRLARV